MTTTRPAVHHVNRLILIVLLLQVSNLFFAWLPPYVRLILNEALFVLLPTFIYLRWAKLPILQTVGWRWPGGRTALLSFFIGAGLYPAAIYLAYLFQMLLGYNLPEIPEMIPDTPIEAVLAFIALAVMAPICEEFLFRGVVQNAYAHRGPARTILFVGLIFVLFHLSLIQGLSIIPLALVLGFVYWRTDSLPASMLTHFGANLLAVLAMIGNVWFGAVETTILSLPSVVIGLLVASLSLFLLSRTTHPDPTPAAPAVTRGGLARNWPLLAALPICLGFFAAEIFAGRSPELLATPVVLDPLPWSEPQTWQYRITNVADEPVGHATCTLTPEADIVTLSCRQEQQGYEVRQGQSYWSSGPLAGERVVQWRRDTGAPLVDTADYEQYHIAWSPGEGAIDVEVAYPGEAPQTWQEPLPPLAQDTLITSEGSWPWQLSALSFETGATARLAHLDPYTWRPATEDNGPVLQVVLVKIVGLEMLDTSAGPQKAWRVEVGEREVAWYDSKVPHTLLRYFNGMETWEMTR
ncbi:MAG: type II CAAX prenyl endopeptidase Rce1 family protein [Anaerolineae bacterium]|jgi:membrane protease YdiL (CAAX protease family)